MSFIPEGSASGKGKFDPAASERINLLHAIQAAISRSRLVTNTLELINVALRHRTVSTEQAKAWLEQERLSKHIHLGPGGVR